MRSERTSYVGKTATHRGRFQPRTQLLFLADPLLKTDTSTRSLCMFTELATNVNSVAFDMPHKALRDQTCAAAEYALSTRKRRRENRIRQSGRPLHDPSPISRMRNGYAFKTNGFRRPTDAENSRPNQLKGNGLP